MPAALHCFALLLALLAAASDPQPPAPGQPAPTLSIERITPSGSEATWERLRGTPVVLNFWATWCAHCVNEIPRWNELVAKFGGVRFLSVTDEKPENVERFLAKRPMAGWIGFDTDSSTFWAYSVGGVPHTVLVDAAGVVRATVLPAQLTDAVIGDLIAGKAIQPPKLEEGKQCVSSSVRSFFRAAEPGGAASIDAGYGRWEGRNVPLRAILANAYGMPESRIEGPEEVLATRYSVGIQMMPGGRDPARLLRMMLERRVKTRRETRQVDGQPAGFLVVEPVESGKKQ